MTAIDFLKYQDCNRFFVGAIDKNIFRNYSKKSKTATGDDNKTAIKFVKNKRLEIIFINVFCVIRDNILLNLYDCNRKD